MTFIRAPFITGVKDGAEIIAYTGGNAVGVKYKNQLAFAFHPELDSDKQIYNMFLDQISAFTA